MHDVCLLDTIRLHPVIVEIVGNITPAVIDGGKSLVCVPPDADHSTAAIAQLVTVGIATDAEDGHDLGHGHTPLVTSQQLYNGLLEVIVTIGLDNSDLCFWHHEGIRQSASLRNGVGFPHSIGCGPVCYWRETMTAPNITHDGWNVIDRLFATGADELLESSDYAHNSLFGLLLKACSMRARAMSMYSASLSMPMKSKPSNTAALPVEPLPMKGSRTIPFGGVTRRHR